jgi:hypothetical protein
VWAATVSFEVDGMATFDFFISHSSATKELARLIYYTGISNGLSLWYDEGVLELGDVLEAEIERGINSSASYLLLHSEPASRSPWVKKEMELAERRFDEDPTFRLRVVKLDQEPLPSTFWDQFLYQNWRSTDQPGSILQLISALTGGGHMVQIPASAVLSSIPSVIFSNESGTVAEHTRNFVLFYMAHVKSLLQALALTGNEAELRDSIQKILDLSMITEIPVIHGCNIPIEPGIFEIIHPNRMRIAPRISLEGLPDRFDWSAVENNEIFTRIEIRERATGKRADYPTPFAISVTLDSEL